MVNMSDILKKLRQQKSQEPKEPKPPQREEKKEPQFPEQKKAQPISYTSKPEPAPPWHGVPGIKYTHAADEIKDMANLSLESQRQTISRAKALEDSKNKSQGIYEEALIRIEILLQKIKDNQKIRIKDIKDTTSRIIDQLVSDDTGLIYIVCSTNTDNYLYAHSVNVCILSLEVGLGLDYQRPRLLDLGLSAMIHDMGMIKVEDIIEKEGILTAQEYEKVKMHPMHNLQILKRDVEDVSELPAQLSSITTQIHERIKGTGYPDGIKEPQIHEYARIISVADTYEALTHKRPHRGAYVASEAMKEVLKRSYDEFDPSIVKALVNRIGIYPVGSWIQLSTNEIGQVVQTNKDYLLKPVINIIFDANGHHLPSTKEIDLVKAPSLTIKNSFSIDQIRPSA